MSGESQLSTDEARTLALALDEIIPPSAERALPGAGDPRVVDLVAGVLASLPIFDAPVRQGLAALEETARKRDVRGFASLSREARLAVLNEVGAADGGFLPSLMVLAFVSYYRDPRVLEALHFETRPPHPKGYELPPNDLSLLDPVRRRGKLYRDA